VGMRLALGFWHFCQDRWNYKFSDPQVRATIGQDLFSQPQGGASAALSPATKMAA
jgi:hypothetical protein